MDSRRDVEIDTFETYELTKADGELTLIKWEIETGTSQKIATYSSFIGSYDEGILYPALNRFLSTTAVHSNGTSFWLFGGISGRTAIADFWRYDIETNVWTLLSGGLFSAPPYYVPGDSMNTPGSISSVILWTDRLGDVWLFGSSGLWSFHDNWERHQETSSTFNVAQVLNVEEDVYWIIGSSGFMGSDPRRQKLWNLIWKVEQSKALT